VPDAQASLISDLVVNAENDTAWAYQEANSQIQLLIQLAKDNNKNMLQHKIN